MSKSLNWNETPINLASHLDQVVGQGYFSFVLQLELNDKPNIILQSATSETSLHL